MTDTIRKSAEATTEDAKRKRTTRWVAAGVATGIGSAALVAALLYAGRTRPEQKPPRKFEGEQPES